MTMAECKNEACMAREGCDDKKKLGKEVRSCPATVLPSDHEPVVCHQANEYFKQIYITNTPRAPKSADQSANSWVHSSLTLTY